MGTSFVIGCIIPKLPPEIDGVGDYALNLARQLRKDFSIQTHFVVGDANWTGATEIEGFAISKVSEPSAYGLSKVLSTLGISTLVLHYVGYGYAKRGCPVWLIYGAERWRTSSKDYKLVTMFHEVYASGAVWTSAFWLSSTQKKLAGRLVQLSDHILTSKESYAQILHKLGGAKQKEITCLPVFSNIGEPENTPPLNKRTRRLVVFGHKNSRLQVYQQCSTALKQTCQALKIEEICDIGIPTGLELSGINSIPVVEKGITEAAEISNILLDSIAGFLNFPPPAHLAKSTIFAAYSAHRLIPVMASFSPVDIDGLQVGKHYLCADKDIQSKQLYLEAGQEIADNAYGWYQTHNLSTQAEIFASYLVQQSREK